MGIKPSDIKTRFEEVKKELQKKTEKGLQVHSIIHEITSMMIENDDIFRNEDELNPLFDECTTNNEIFDCLRNWSRYIFSKNKNGHRIRDYIVSAECILIDPNSGITGTADLIVLFPDNIPLIVDYKTASYRVVIETHVLQMLSYGSLLESLGVKSNQALVYLGGEQYSQVHINVRFAIQKKLIKVDENSIPHLCSQLQILIEKKKTMNNKKTLQIN